jgi:hypothetical protein
MAQAKPVTLGRWSVQKYTAIRAPLIYKSKEKYGELLSGAD